MAYSLSYSKRISSVISQVDSLEVLIKKSTDGKYSDAMIKALETLKTSLNEVNNKYNAIPKKF